MAADSVGSDKSGLRATRRATLVGSVAVLLWAVLALLTTYAAGLPPFQLLAMTFAVAFLLGLGWLAMRGGGALARLKQPLYAWAIGVGGLFGYHFFYFRALANAPPVDASLIAYLWPLLIVLLSASLPGERLRWYHVCGAVMGLFGAALLVTGGAGVTVKPEFLVGYLFAGACALIWSGYSIANRRYCAAVPSDAVTGFCGAVAVLALICHLMWERTVVPDLGQSLAALGLGLGPVGAAFFVWDYGTKHGNVQALGGLSYGAPLLSTILLVAFGLADATWLIAAACLLIVGGAVLASGDLLRRRPVTTR